MSVEDYLRLDGEYLARAREYLAKGDLLQASEKYWGAVAEAVKALAAKKAVKLGTHRSISEYVSRLQREHPDMDLLGLYQIANTLHINFYEDYLPADQVEYAAKRCEEMLSLLRRFIETSS